MCFIILGYIAELKFKQNLYMRSTIYITSTQNVGH